MREKIKAVSYLRTSSASNVGAEKNSAARQRFAIAAFAKRAGYQIVEEFNDEAVSGTDAIEVRPGFGLLLDRIETNGVRNVLVEDASRFARHVLTQELGVMALKERGVKVFTAGGDELTATDDPSKVMVRQMMAAFAQFEKARLVGKLAAARRRKREAFGKCEGRKKLSEIQPDVVELAKKLRRKTRAGRRSLRLIAAELAAKGHFNENNRPYNPKSIKAMLDV